MGAAYALRGSCGDVTGVLSFVAGADTSVMAECGPLAAAAITI